MVNTEINRINRVNGREKKIYYDKIHKRIKPCNNFIIYLGGVFSNGQKKYSEIVNQESGIFPNLQ